MGRLLLLCFALLGLLTLVNAQTNTTESPEEKAQGGNDDDRQPTIPRAQPGPGNDNDNGEEDKGDVVVIVAVVSCLLVLAVLSSLVAYKRRKLMPDPIDFEEDKPSIPKLSLASINSSHDILDEKGFHAVHYSTVKGDLSELAGHLQQATDFQQCMMAFNVSSEKKDNFGYLPTPEDSPNVHDNDYQMLEEHRVPKHSSELFLPDSSLNFTDGFVESELNLLTEGERKQSRMSFQDEDGSVKKLINLQDRSGNTLIALAVRYGHQHIVEYLLLRGVTVDIPNKDNCTPLHVACMLHQRPDMAMSLIGGGADVNARDNEGNTPLMYAAGQGSTEVVVLLLQKGALVDEQSRHGMTALMLGAMNGHERVVNILLSLPEINTKAQDSGGRTALHWACSVGSAGCVKSLMGKNLELAFDETSNGDTPCHIAIVSDNSLCVEAVVDALSERQRVRLFTVTNAAGDSLESSASSKLAVLSMEVLEKYRGSLSVDLVTKSPAPFPPPPSDSEASNSPRISLSPPEIGSSPPAVVPEDSTSAPGGTKQKQTIEQARERRRTYMRQKRAQEAQMTKDAEDKVAALSQRKIELESIVQRMRDEAYNLKAELGLINFGAPNAGGPGTAAPVGNIVLPDASLRSDTLFLVSIQC
eukprot:m.35064 g.35064  ORF g.35064 m.35064 type:complete len:642 (+) comp8821_c0_seq2:290-2215(+)